MTGSSRHLAEVRTLFLSDIHLGYRRARVRELAEFLAAIDAQTIVLAGDIHGDQFDGIVPCAPWMTRVGDALYYATVAINHGVNDLRRALGRPYWPLVESIKLGIAPSVRYIERFESVAAGHARGEGYDGVVCGHIHRANLWDIGGTLYCNTGDWVESCTAAIETLDGELQLLRWPNGLSPARRPTPQLIADAA